MLALLGAIFVLLIALWFFGTILDGWFGHKHRDYDHNDMLGSGDDDF